MRRVPALVAVAVAMPLGVSLCLAPAVSAGPTTRPAPSSAVASVQQNPTPDQVAAAIYVQSRGLGTGDVGALVAIMTALAESGLSNDTDGDCWGANPQCSLGRTSSRGVFQQFWSWAPPGTAWSGQKAPTGGYGTPYDQFNATNAWGPGGWAVSDPRMNVAQAANMFLLGPHFNRKGGLEDLKLFAKVKGKNALRLPPATVTELVMTTQGTPTQLAPALERLVPTARQYLQRVRSGKVPLPAFVTPLPGIR